MALQQIVEFEPRNASANCADGWRRFVTIEPNGGARHVITTWTKSTRGAAMMAAQGNGADFVEVKAGTYQ